MTTELSWAAVEIGFEYRPPSNRYPGRRWARYVKPNCGKPISVVQFKRIRSHKGESQRSGRAT
jgi:hypothetical protein